MNKISTERANESKPKSWKIKKIISKWFHSFKSHRQVKNAFKKLFKLSKPNQMFPTATNATTTSTLSIIYTHVILAFECMSTLLNSVSVCESVKHNIIAVVATYCCLLQTLMMRGINDAWMFNGKLILENWKAINGNRHASNYSSWVGQI